MIRDSLDKLHGQQNIFHLISFLTVRRRVMRKPQISLLTVSVSVASLLLASTTSFAHANYKENYKGEAMPTCPVELVLKDGFYIGLQGGYDMYRIVDDVPDDGFLSAPDGDRAISVDPRVFASGGVGGGFIGYGHYFGSEWWGAYLGLEIFGNWSGASTDYELQVATDTAGVLSDFDLYTAKFKVKSNYGIDVLPGVKLNPATLFYVRLGYNWANISVDETFDSNINTVSELNSSSDSGSETPGGFHYGVGIESTFYDNWSVRAEYTHTDFNNVDSDWGSEISPGGNQFLLGVIYHFNM